jgi:hypothetical protein
MAAEVCAGEGEDLVAHLEARDRAADGFDLSGQLGSEDGFLGPKTPKKRRPKSPNPAGKLRLRARQSPVVTVVA